MVSCASMKGQSHMKRGIHLWKQRLGLRTLWVSLGLASVGTKVMQSEIKVLRSPISIILRIHKAFECYDLMSLLQCSLPIASKSATLSVLVKSFSHYLNILVYIYIHVYATKLHIRKKNCYDIKHAVVSYSFFLFVLHLCSFDISVHGEFHQKIRISFYFLFNIHMYTLCCVSPCRFYLIYA